MQHLLATESGVSEVIGEMLMIVLVIMLLSVFSAALYHYLPADRDPSVTIRMSNDTQNITLWHKGGDWVKAEEITVVIGEGDTIYRFSKDSEKITFVPHKDVFDLGGNITVRMPHDLLGNETVKLVTPRTMIYTGRISL